jgi:myo-inositol-1(or 4)-monophosphatase
MLKEFTGLCRAIRRAGSAALDLAYVASGRTDGFWEFALSPWDIAAGVVLVREAGGFVGDPSGGDTFMRTGNIVAANTKCFKLMVQHLRPHLTPGLR